MSNERPRRLLGAGNVLAIRQRRDEQQVTIGSDRGTFEITTIGRTHVRTGDSIEIEWVVGLPLIVYHGGSELWRARLCDLCGLTEMEHDLADCKARHLAAEAARIRAHGECPACDLGIDFAVCTCPPGA